MGLPPWQSSARLEPLPAFSASAPAPDSPSPIPFLVPTLPLCVQVGSSVAFGTNLKTATEKLSFSKCANSYVSLTLDIFSLVNEELSRFQKYGFCIKSFHLYKKGWEEIELPTRSRG